jgi:anti-sigma B factor antagonist
MPTGAVAPVPHVEGVAGMKGSEPPLTIRVESRNGVTLMVLAGELDLATAPILQRHFETLDGDGVSAVMLDLRDLRFVDSTGVHMFLQARSDAEANGHRLLLIGAQPHVRRLFELTNTVDLLGEREAVSVLDRFTGSTRRRRNGLDQEGDARG